MSEVMIAYFGYGSLVNTRTLQSDYIAAIPAGLKGWRRHWQARAEKTDAPLRSGAEQRLWSMSLRQMEQGTFSNDATADRHLTLSDIALLSVHEETASQISGLIIIDRISALTSLDERERLYDRRVIDPANLLVEEHELLGEVAPENLFLYVGQTSPQGETVLLQSYLHTVMAGFLRVHGEAGLADFMASTIGFDRRMVADRAFPIYPRAALVSDEEARRFDAILGEAGVKFG